jgi:four helix bundle protein
MVKTFRDLLVWQEAMNLVEMVYLKIEILPKEERYGLASQMKRAAVSIPANIAEGNGRKSRKEYIHFLSIANGSLRELETHILIAERLHFMTKENSEPIHNQLQTVGRLLTALRKSLRRTPLLPTPHSLLPISKEN